MSVQAKVPVDLLSDALDVLAAAVTISPAVPSTSHMVVRVDGLESPEVPGALGRYLVGAVAGAVGLDARLSEQLLARGVNRQEEIRREVAGLIGPTNAFPTADDRRFRDTRRNAWIGEGVAHALLMLGAMRETPCVDGQVQALTAVHPTTTRQGLDSVSAYVQAGVLGIAIGESKSTCSRASENLGDAIGLFVQIEQGEYQQDLRRELSAFRHVLSPDLAVQLRDSLWTDNASYLPMIVHQDPYNFMNPRPNLAGLAQPLQRRRVIVVQLAQFHAFFNAVADAMRAAVPEVVV
ncbi:hypothetical protein ACIODS_25410 [Micromonospora chalcea]|uniref:hypothetical protein n=1 Tax=Micromonospora chalcea TaxID=1874 RepID=UPI0037F59351